MKKYIFIIIFTLGLSIFLYPIISNMVATTSHQNTIRDYRETVSKLDEKQLKDEKKKVEKHNKELSESDLNFVDPFSEKENIEKGSKSYYDALNVGATIGTVEIPKINVELPIYHGTSAAVLSRGAGHLENSSLPTNQLGTHSVITAHRGLPSAKLFRHLDKIQVGDVFYVEVLDETLAYKVENIDVVLPSETEWIKMEEDKNKMTLLTCEPYMINTHRMLVTGHQIPYLPDEKEEAKKDYNNYYALASLVIFILLLIYFLKKRKKKDEES